MACKNTPEGEEGVGRREVLLTGSIAIAATLAGPVSLGLAASPASERPKKGDRLIIDDEGENKGKPVSVEMVPVGGPLVFAWPVDAETGTVRDKSRFNRLVLIRLAPEDLDEDIREHAVEGVIAYSAICTHEGCTVSGWEADKKAISCFCHLSVFDAANGGRVLSGPAKRRLPILPLALGDDGALVAADKFTAKPGPKA